MSTILCTGGAGFIGSHLVDKLILEGHTIVILDNLSTGNINNIIHDNFFNRNLNDKLDDIFSKYQFDYVFHLAAFINLRESIVNPYECNQNNILGSINLINYCNKYKVKKIIFSSTGGAIYSPLAKLPWSEKSLAEPSSPYGLSKLNIEQYLKINHTLYNLDYSILRYSNVYGPRQNVLGEAGVISIFIDRILQNKNIKIFGSGKQERDFIYVSDVVSANINMITLLNQTKNKIYNVSSCQSISVEIIANMLLSRLNTSSSDKEYHPIIEGELLLTKLDNNEIYKDTGWYPQIDFVNGLNQTIDFFRKN